MKDAHRSTEEWKVTDYICSSIVFSFNVFHLSISVLFYFKNVLHRISEGHTAFDATLLFLLHVLSSITFI